MRKMAARVTGGMDSFLRVANVLRRREFDVFDMSMRRDSDADEFTDIYITIEDKGNLSLSNAMRQLNKVVGVYEIKELEGEY